MAGAWLGVRLPVCDTPGAVRDFRVAGCLLWPVAAGVLAEADAVARLEGLLAQALEANERLEQLAAGWRSGSGGDRAAA